MKKLGLILTLVVTLIAGLVPAAAAADFGPSWGTGGIAMLPLTAGTVVAEGVVAEGVEPKDGQVAGSSDPALASGRSVSLGIHTLIGEIVDSKCHLGVMKPGNRKAHRACASLCIRGGVPPVFIVREGGSVTEHLLLVGSDGRALNQEVLDWVAEPVEIHGEVIRLDDRWLLKAEPKSFKRSQ